MKSVGAAIAAWRRARGLTQQRLADLAGLDKSTLYKTEQSERRQPRPETVSKIAEALGVDPEVLFRLEAPAKAGVYEPTAAHDTPFYEPREGDLVTCLEEGRATHKVVQIIGGEAVLSPLSKHDGRLFKWGEDAVQMLSYTRRIPGVSDPASDS